MKKLLKILSFVSLGIIGLSAMGILLCYVFWGPLLELCFRRGTVLPRVLPVGNAVALVGQLGAMIWLCICVGNRRFGFWSELMAAGWLGAVLPLITRLLSWIQSYLFTFGDLGDVTARSIMSMVWSYVTVFNSAAVSLALVVCGLSMADKYLGRRALQETS